MCPTLTTLGLNQPPLAERKQSFRPNPPGANMRAQIYTHMEWGSCAGTCSTVQ